MRAFDDLKSRAERFSLDCAAEVGSIIALFDDKSLKVVCAMNDNIVAEVLDLKRYPLIELVPIMN